MIYSLCQKPLLSAALVATSLCEFPPLLKDVPVRLEAAGSVVTADITVPVDLNYALLLDMSNPDGDTLSKQEISILGDRRVETCSETTSLDKVPPHDRVAFGRPMPFKVEVRRKADNMLVYARQVTTMCVASKWANQRSRSLGNFTLVRGAYNVRIENVAAQAGLERLKATLVLQPELASN